jgi:ABC-type sulfate transport system substrate-binding protein
MKTIARISLALAFIGTTAGRAAAQDTKPATLLNVSYDPTREL